MIKTIKVCDCCGTELKSNADTYHINFVSSKFCDAAGDVDYNSIDIELCEHCCLDAVKSLRQIVQKGL